MRTVWDADTHIAEPPEMWSFLDAEWYPRRPVIVSLPDDTQYGASDHMWLIDGQIFPKAAGRGGNLLVTPTIQKTVRDRVDVKARELLDLPICVHQGQGAPALNNLIDIQRSHTFTHGRLPPLVAFRNIVANAIPELFPKLRWGFIETGLSWIPFVLYQLRGTRRADPTFWGPRLFEEYNIWVSYELGEDLPYALQYVGEDHVVVGTDYGHHTPGTTDRLAADPSAQVHMVNNLRGRSELSPELLDKLLVHNSARLYGG